MDAQKCSLKIALLVDVDSYVRNSSNCDFSNALDLTKTASLKLLLACSKSLQSPSNQFRWAHYIFSQSNDLALRPLINKRAKFRELSSDSFQNFERYLESLAQKKFCNNEDDNLNPPAKQIRNAIQNTLADLQWTPPDITSPIKKLKRGKTAPPNVLYAGGKCFENHIFLFTFCPHNYCELKTYVSDDYKYAQDEGKLLENVIEDMIPVTLQHTITEACKIKIHFVDLTAACHKFWLQGTLTGDGKAYLFIEKGLEAINGQVFSISRLTSCSTISSKLSLEENEVHIKRCGHLQEQSVIHCESYVRQNLLQIPLNSADVAEKKATVIFGDSQDSAVMTLNVVLKPVESNTVVADSVSALENFGSLAGSSTSSGCTLAAGHSVRVEHHGSAVCGFQCYAQDSSDKGNCDSEKTNNVDIGLRVLGTVLQHEVPPLYEYLPRIYFLCPALGENTKLFERIMLHSTEKQIAHVMEVKVAPGEVCLGLFQPLTRLSGTLAIIEGAGDYCLDKLLLKATSSAARDKQLNEFVDESIALISGIPTCEIQSEVYDTGTTASYTQDVHAFSTCFLENYYLPGTESCASQAAIAHANVDEDKSVCDFELKLLRKLQKKYMAKKSVRLNTRSKHTPGTPRKTPRKSGKIARGFSGLRRSPRKKCSAVLSNEASKLVLPPRIPVKKSRSHTAPTRTDQLWQKYRKSVVVHKDKGRESDRGVTEATVKKGKEESVRLVGNLGDMEKEEDLTQFLSSFYADVMDNSNVSLIGAAQTLVNTCVHFFKSKNIEEPEKKACDTLSGLLLENSAIKDKHKGNSDEQALFREYELQIVLYAELETVVTFEREDEAVEDKITKVAGILRAMSFMRDPEFLGNYMKNVMLQNYVDTAPVFLTKIYDELLLPLPAVLESLLSPDELTGSATKSVNPLLSVASNASTSSTSLVLPSDQQQKERKLNRYRSFHAVSNRQIAVPKIASGKEKRRTPRRKRRMSTRIASMTKRSAVKNNNDNKGSDSKKVCKNLFGEEDGQKKAVKLERRQSCMAAIQTKPRRQARTPKKHHVLKSRRVAETPAHKQRNNMVWRRHEKERQRTRTAGDVKVVAESPDKQPSEDSAKHTPKKTSKQLAKQRSFYSENVTRAEKLEARLMNQKILSPTWNKPKFGSLLQKTPPRRVQPRMLFSSLASPSPQKVPQGNIPQSPVAARALFNIGKAVAQLNFMQSPSKNTRSQQANVKAFTALTGDPFQRCFTPHGRTVLKTPVKVADMPNVPKTPATLEKRTVFQTPTRQGESCGSVSRRVSFSTTLLTPQKEMHRPCPNFQSPIKSILTPTKHFMPVQVRESVLEGRLPAQLRLRETPQKSNDAKDDSALNRSPDVPAVMLSGGLDSSSNENSAEQSPRITRSTTKTKLSFESNSASANARAKTNLRSLFEMKSDINPFRSEDEADLKGLVKSSDRSCDGDVAKSLTVYSAVPENKENDMDGEEPSEIKRRTLRSRTRSNRALSFQFPKNLAEASGRDDSQSAWNADLVTRQMSSRGLKRKDTDELPDRPSHKRSCSRMSGSSMQSLGSLADNSAADYSDVFVDDSAVNRTRNSEGPLTRSSLMSDNSNSAFSFGEHGNIQRTESSESVSRGKTGGGKAVEAENFIRKNVRLKLLAESVGSESSRSPEFGEYLPMKNLPLKFLGSGIAAESDSSRPSSPLCQKERTKTPVPDEAGPVIPMTTPSRNIRACSASSDKQLNTFSPSVQNSLQSPSGGKKFSPLSTKGLVQLTESPILDGGSERRKAKCIAMQKISPKGVIKAGAEREGEKVAEVSPMTKRHARRSLYRSQTNTNFKK